MSQTDGPAANQVLIQWSSDKPNWAKAIVKGAIECQRPLSEDELDQVFSRFLVENSLSEGQPELIQITANAVTTADPRPVLRLTKMTHLGGVNALKAPSEIDFNPKMTLIFGENAAGKSGYVRILKALSSARCVEEILPHLGARTPPPRRVQINFAVGETQHDVEWDFDKPIEELSDVDVFDSRFAQIHVDDRLEYSYTPSEVAVFPIVADAIHRVRTKLSALIDATLMYQSNFQAGIPEGVSFRHMLADVGADTKIADLRDLANLSEDDVAAHAQVQETIVALQAADTAATLKQANQDIAVLEEASAAYAAIKEFDWLKFDACLSELGAAMQAYADSGLRDLEAPTRAVDSEEWRRFIEAGEQLVQTHVGADYPTEASSCIYCGQALDPDALALLTRYRAYATGDLRRAVETASTAFQDCAKELRQSDFGATVAKLKARAHAETGITKNLWTEIAQFAEQAEAARNEICAGQSLAEGRRSAFTDAAVQKIGNLKAQIETLAQALSGETSSRLGELARAKVLAAEFAARGSLKELLPAIERSIQAASWVKSAQDALNKFTKMLRLLTAAAKQASSELLNSGFETRFSEESEKLHAPKVNLTFPGGDARVERKKFISDKYTLSQILSEGEQKAIALADFLAETRLRTSSSPIIFDDPVNSLDYKRIGYVAARLAQLSEDRQIVVFTHNIWLASEILSYFDKRTTDCTYYDIEAQGEEKGVLSKGTSPRTDTFKKNRATINDLIQAAQNLTGAARQALVERGYEYLRNTCEIVVERELFQEVARRYEPNIRMTKLDSIKYDRLQTACSKTFEIFEECCRKIASHSQPTETLNVKATLDDLKRDWQALQDVHSEYSAK